MDAVLEHHIIEEERKFDLLASEIKELRQEIKDLTEAWQQAKGVVTFVKWMVSIAGGITAFLLFIKDHLK